MYCIWVIWMLAKISIFSVLCSLVCIVSGHLSLKGKAIRPPPLVYKQDKVATCSCMGYCTCLDVCVACTWPLGMCVRGREGERERERRREGEGGRE